MLRNSPTAQFAGKDFSACVVVKPLTPNILTLILPTCHEQNIWTVLGELVARQTLTQQEITCQFLHTVPYIAGYKLKGEVCLWSQQEITCQFLHTVTHIAGYKLKGEVCIWSAVGAQGLKRNSTFLHFVFILNEAISVCSFQPVLGQRKGKSPRNLTLDVHWIPTNSPSSFPGPFPYPAPPGNEDANSPLISELLFASVSKRAPVQSLSYEN